MLVMLAIVLAFYIWFYVVVLPEVTEAKDVALIVMVFVIFLLASFSTLTITVDDAYMRVKFGYWSLQNIWQADC